MYSTELQHHGIKGQKWGVRRFQNDDGTLTPAGRSRYRNSDGSLTKEGVKETKRIRKTIKKKWWDAANRAGQEMNERDLPTINKKYENDYFDSSFSSKRGQQYVKEVSGAWKRLYTSELKKLVPQESMELAAEFIQNAPMMTQYDRFIQKH